MLSSKRATARKCLIESSLILSGVALLSYTAYEAVYEVSGAASAAVIATRMLLCTAALALAASLGLSMKGTVVLMLLVRARYAHTILIACLNCPTRAACRVVYFVGACSVRQSLMFAMAWGRIEAVSYGLLQILIVICFSAIPLSDARSEERR